MAVVAAWGNRHPPEAIFAVLVESAAWILLHVDERRLVNVEAKLADNIGWLDFTHMLTFAEAAVTAIAAAFQRFGPPCCCSLPASSAAMPATSMPAWTRAATLSPDIAAFIAERRNALFDHGRDRFIISVHLIKTLLAGAT